MFMAAARSGCLWVGDRRTPRRHSFAPCAHAIAMLPFLSSVFGLSSPLLFEARARTASSARQEFATALSSNHDELALSILIAAEERHLEPPSAVAEQVHARLAALVDVVQNRLRLGRALDGGEQQRSAEMLCATVSTSLFGSGGAPDDEEADCYFSGNAADYYDPLNSMIDRVLERRTGAPTLWTRTSI